MEFQSVAFSTRFLCLLQHTGRRFIRFVLMLFKSSCIDVWKNINTKHLLQFISEIGYTMYLSGYETWHTQFKHF